MADSFMPFFLPLLFIVLTTRILLENVVVVKGDPDLTFVSAYCGTEHDVTPFRKSQATRLINTAIQDARPGKSLCIVTAEEPGTVPLLYARATCSDSVSEEDCTTCIRYAQDQLLNYNICHDEYGAQITVVSCSMRYEPYKIAECPPLPPYDR